MLPYSVLLINKTLCRAEALPEIWTNLPEQKLATVKLNNLIKIL